MTDRPILFSAPMVRALLAGTKTQTRRILNPQPTVNTSGLLIWERKGWFVQGKPSDVAIAQRIHVGDRLWVREGWRCNGWATDVATIFYAASEGDGYTAMCEQYPVADRRPLRVTAGWRPSIHMPRWASRLTLTVTEVRVERLQDISEADCVAEGIEWMTRTASGNFYRHFDAPGMPIMAFGAYRSLWNHINGAGAWDVNPWVVAYTFTVQRSNIDQMAEVAA
jgi:hypothetical protein